MPKSKYILIKQRKLRVINYYIYYVPVTIDTDFLGSPLAFGTYSNDNPFEVNNFIGNNYAVSYINGQYVEASTNGAPYYETGDQNLTFFAYPSSLSSIGYISPEIPSIANGYWSNGNFNANPPVLHNGGITNCAEYGTVNNCLTFEGTLNDEYSWLVKKYEIGSLSFFNGFPPYNYHNTSTTSTLPPTNPDYPGNETINTSYFFGLTGYSNQESQTTNKVKDYFPRQQLYPEPTPLYYTGLSGKFSNIMAPSTIKLNYGYYIPIYLGSNENYGGYCGSAYYDGGPYSNIPDALNASKKAYGYYLGTCGLDTDTYPSLNLYLFNVSEPTESFNIYNSNVSHLDKQIIIYHGIDKSDKFTLLSLKNNTPNGFTDDSPFIKYEGSSTFSGSNIANTYSITAVYNSQSSWSDENGYIFYELDSGYS